MLHKCLISLLLTLGCIISVQASFDFNKLTGIWVRKDVMQKLRTTRSFFQTKKYIEAQPFSNFLAVGINYTPSNYTQLGVSFSQFNSPQMPPSMFLSIDQKPTTLGYKLKQTYLYQNYTFHLSIKKENLWVHIQKGNIKRWLVFEKVAKAPVKLMYDKFTAALRQIIRGGYELRDSNNTLIKPLIWFDKNGITNFPQLYRYNIRGGFWNSIHYQINAQKAKTDSSTNTKVLDQEDLLFLYNQGDSFKDKKQFALKKVKNGFHIYELKEPEVRMHQLLYKEKLRYRLIKK